ncbi:hypothetical protein HYFRA_00007677 [Hymenoscyphus fraxineus]|uniref:Zn(2)-C6 fungal-type domain-containing protein n=1 Tax=Hymenoscyphus fraxineus TaxID=746836 RepID=A0A9N9KSW3_9HELO|nr:hypothetical protein HYFRA_00007677 [Hymenoscyphus fraxineus]
MSAASNDHDVIAHPPQGKRNRPQLSCTNCRHAKSKCDRQVPCTQCIKKGRVSTCTIPASLPRKKAAASMQNRLRHLESLVKNVMSQENPIQISPSNSDGQPSQGAFQDEIVKLPNHQKFETGKEKESPPPISTARVVQGSAESTYVGATHWGAILEDIEEVRGFFEEFEPERDAPERDLSPFNSMAFNGSHTLSKENLLSGLPDKKVVDHLVARHFNSNSPSLSIIHAPTFQKDYRKFWEAPSSVSANWLGLLYAMLTISSLVVIGGKEVHPDTRGTPHEMLRFYRRYCTQALITSNYTKPSKYTIETMIIFAEAEFLLSKDDEVYLYLFVGNIVRLCLRMGLHRDASKIDGTLTPYQSEIRRRLWHHVSQLDMLSCFHIGLPGMVDSIDSDTLLPRNLRDEDFGEDTIELPPSRSPSELTPISYLIAKSILCQEAGKITTMANRLTRVPYEDILKLDKSLHHAFDQIPIFYRLSRTGISITDSANVIVKQFSMFLVYHKCRCMLHRNYLAYGEDTPEYTFSKKEALDASMELLSGQAMTYEAATPGGPLANDRWFLSTLSTHDFLLAALLICVEVMKATKAGLSLDNINDPKNKELLSLLQALEKSHVVWEQVQDKHCPQATTYFEVMFSRVKSGLRSQSQKNTAYEPDAISSLPYGAESCQLPWGNFQAANVTSPGFGFLSNDDILAMADNSIGSFAEITDNLDWETFDNYAWPRQETQQESWQTDDFLF